MTDVPEETPDPAPEETPQETGRAAEPETERETDLDIDQDTDDPGTSAQGEGDELALARMEVAELTADLQRLQAEYLNYKRRVDRDRELVRENATYAALTPIIEVLDSIDRAREHGPLDDGFQAVAEQLERAVSSVGLTRYGEVGDPFDPAIHDALSHIGEDPEVAVTTCKVVATSGYRIGDRVVRAAQVLVVDPVTTAAAPADPPTEPTEPTETTEPTEAADDGE